MNIPPPITFTASLQRKDPKLPVYVVVPYAQIAHWNLEATTMVEGTLNGQAFGRRSIKRMNAASDSDWFIEFTAPICKALGVEVDDKLNVALCLATTDVPKELADLLSANPPLRAAWNAVSDYSRRTSAEHIRAAKTEATRVRRAQAIASQLSARSTHGDS